PALLSLSLHDALPIFAFDSKNNLLFAGCGNKKLIALDAETWKVAGSVEIGERCDGVAFDPGTQNVFASCRDKTGGMHVKGPAQLDRKSTRLNSSHEWI